METRTMLGALFGVTFICVLFVVWRWYTGLQGSSTVFIKIKKWWNEMTLREAQGYMAGLIGISCVIWVLGIYARWITYVVYYVTPVIVIIGFYQIKIKGGKKENNKGRTP